VSERLPRELHPGAWWLWALGLATAASRTTNPLLLGAVLAVVAYVVAARRGDAPWSRGFKAYLVMALVIIALRVVFRMLLDGQYGEHVLFRLPEIPLPAAAAGIRLGGPVSLEGVLAAIYDGVRLATLLICIGAANVLANPKRLLKSTPAALHEVGVAVTVALSVAPQLVESVQRVRRARRLRSGARKGAHVLRQIIVPVATDALDRSLMLAAAMDARGHGRRVERRRGVAHVTGGALVLVGLCGVCLGIYGLLDASTSRALGLTALFGGLTSAAVGFVLGGRQVHTTRYRPDPWLAPEWAVAASGIFVAAALFFTGSVNPDALNPSLQPLQWPTLPIIPFVAILVGALPAWLAPPVQTRVARDPGGARAATLAPVADEAGVAPKTASPKVPA
jgi:energy-coupling factor transport system permease protein